MFGYNSREFVNVFLDYDPAADDVIPLFRATQDCEVKSAYAIMTNDLAADGTNYFALHLMNGGTVGTATTVVSGTIGGTAGWTGLTPTDFVVSDGTLSAGEVLVLNYNENGTGTFTSINIQLEILSGVGADA